MTHFWVTTHQSRTAGVDKPSLWAWSGNSLSAYSEHSVSCGSGPGVALCMPSWRHAPSEWTRPISSTLRNAQASGRARKVWSIFIAPEKVLNIFFWQHFIDCKAQIFFSCKVHLKSAVYKSNYQHWSLRPTSLTTCRFVWNKPAGGEGWSLKCIFNKPLKLLLINLKI